MSREGSPLSHPGLNPAGLLQRSSVSLWHLGDTALLRGSGRSPASGLAHGELPPGARLCEGAKHRCLGSAAEQPGLSAGPHAGSRGSAPFQPRSRFPRRSVWISPRRYSLRSCKYDQKYLILLTASAARLRSLQRKTLRFQRAACVSTPPPLNLGFYTIVCA